MLKRALFAGAAMVIGAMYMQGAVTPALAGPNVKPKVKVAPKPRIRIVKPKIRIKIDPRRFARDKQEKTSKDPTALRARTAGQPALRGKLTDQVFQAMLGDFLEAAEAAKEAAAAAEAARQIKDFDIAFDGLVPVDPKDGLTGGGNAGNNEGPIGMSPDEFANRFGAAMTASEFEAARLADRYGAPTNGSSAVGDWSKSTGIAPDYTRIPTGGLSSTRTTTTHTEGNTTTVKTSFDSGDASVTKSTSGEGGWTHSRAVYGENGNLTTTSNTSVSADGRMDYTTRDWGFGIGRSYSNYGNTPLRENRFMFDRQTGGIIYMPTGGINRTQTGEEQASGGVLPLPSCGSASCNAMRDLLRNPLGALQQYIASKSTRTNPGPDGGTPNPQGPSVSALINQDDLVKTNVAGDAANSETNRTARELKDKGVRY